MRRSVFKSATFRPLIRPPPQTMTRGLLPFTASDTARVSDATGSEREPPNASLPWAGPYKAPGSHTKTAELSLMHSGPSSAAVGSQALVPALPALPELPLAPVSEPGSNVSPPELVPADAVGAPPLLPLFVPPPPQPSTARAITTQAST